jgi:uncharacterized alkaline shock family protein YloU
VTADLPPSPGPIPPVPVARLVHDAVQAVPGVARLTGGRVSEYATYLPGERIAGVRLGTDVVHVHVVLQATDDLRVVADQVHEAVRQALVAGGTVPVPAVHVHVEDIDLRSAPTPGRP